MKSILPRRRFIKSATGLLLLPTFNIFIPKVRAQGTVAARQAIYGEDIPTTGLTLTFTQSTLEGSFIAVGMRPSDGSANLTVTMGGQTFTKVADVKHGGVDYRLNGFILYNAPAGTEIVMTGGDTADQQRGWAVEFTGMPTSGDIEDFSTATGSGNVLNAGNIDTLTSGALMIFWGSTDSDEFHTDPTPSSGWTMINLQDGTPPLGGAYDDDKTAVMWKVAGGAGNYGGTQTDDLTPDWAAIIGAFSSGGGGSEPSAYSHQSTGSVTRTGSMTRRKM